MKTVKFFAISFIITLCAVITSCGDDDDTTNVGNEGGNGSITGTVAKVDVKKAGSLSTLISDDVKFNITDLTVTGDINGDDIALIREMAGADVNGDETKGHLSILNLKDANIVAGGNPYYVKSTTEACYSKKNIIGSYMFTNCKLTNVILPSNATEIGSYIFNNTGNDGFSIENTTLTSIIIGDKVTVIGYGAFRSCIGLTEIIIPNSVIKIGESAFSECVNLANINLPNSVSYIGSGVFSGCINLTSIDLPTNLYMLNNSVFSRCTNLARVNLASVTQISEGAFSGCNIKEFTVSENNRVYSSLDGVLFNKDKTELVMYPKAKSSQNYVIPNSVTSVNDEAFGNCNNLASITIGDNVTRMNSLNIGSKLTEYIVTENNINYSSLDGVLFDKDKTELIAYPIAKVNSNYIIPSSVYKIKKSVYFNSSLTTINLNYVTAIEAYPFSGSYIREFIVPVANSNFSVKDGILFNKKQTALIAYPMGLMKDYEPNGQGSSYVIPNGVETICAYAFYPTLEMVTIDGAIHLKVYPLETLIIPASVQDIGLFAIYGALNIRCKGETPPRLLSYYSGELADRNIYVPMSAVNAYKQAVGWREANIIGE